MGWGRTLLLGDIGNRMDIADTEDAINTLSRDVVGAVRKDLTQDQQIESLNAENAELKIYLAAVVRLLAAKGVLTEEELEAVVNAVDSGKDGPG